jgi:hypothetical protein
MNLREVSQMSLLQNPIKALDQIEWYLDNKNLENFPGSFLLAGGNLSRQVLEQILFILAFYSGLPQNKYMKVDKRLKTAEAIINALKSTNPTTGRTYFDEAQRKGPRIKKFTHTSQSLDRWRKLFNEPSHFKNPAARRATKESDIRSFIKRIRAILDEKDAHLITAAVNEIKSGGKIKATLYNDEDNTPGILYESLVTPSCLTLNDNGSLNIKTQALKFKVIPDTHEVPNRWTKTPVLVKHSEKIAIGATFVTDLGDTLDFSKGNAAIIALCKSEKLRKRLQKIGFIKISD